jgi:hypothetical protein
VVVVVVVVVCVGVWVCGGVGGRTRIERQQRQVYTCVRERLPNEAPPAYLRHVVESQQQVWVWVVLHGARQGGGDGVGLRLVAPVKPQLLQTSNLGIYLWSAWEGGGGM